MQLGFAEAYVAADQAVHRAARLHVCLHVGYGRQLIGRFLVRKRVFHFLLPRRIGAEAEALHGGAACVYVDQVERELFRGLAGAGHRA